MKIFEEFIDSVDSSEIVQTSDEVTSLQDVTPGSFDYFLTIEIDEGEIWTTTRKVEMRKTLERRLARMNSILDIMPYVRSHSEAKFITANHYFMSKDSNVDGLFIPEDQFGLGFVGSSVGFYMNEC